MTRQREQQRRLSSTAGRIGMPDVVHPMLATPAHAPFDSPDHIFELLWGGLRVMAYVRDGEARLRGRNGIDLTPYFPELRTLPDRLRAREAIVDGEIVVVDADAQPSFDLLRPRLHLIAKAVAAERSGEPDLPVDMKLKKLGGQLTFEAYDLLWLDGRSMLDRPLWQRRNRLHDMLIAAPEFAPTDFVDDEGIAFYEAVLERRLEGIVAKQKTSPYVPGERSRHWLEIRALQSGDFVIGGYAFGAGRRKGEPFNQLLLGAYADGRFEYVGSVSGGLSDAEARDLLGLLEPLLADASPFIDPPPIPRLIYWTRPELACHVRFSEWTREGLLRFPIFSALRPDLDPQQCVVDE